MAAEPQWPLLVLRAWFLKVHTPTKTLVRNHVRAHVCVNHLRVMHEITHPTQVQEFQLKILFFPCHSESSFVCSETA